MTAREFIKDFVKNDTYVYMLDASDHLLEGEAGIVSLSEDPMLDREIGDVKPFYMESSEKGEPRPLFVIGVKMEGEE